MKPILTCVCFLLLVCPGFAKDNRPNVVALFVDDLGYRDIGCYGGPVKTPVLDKLAAGGVRFTDFHSGAATCCPSRATFLTGRHHYRAGVYSVITERLHKMHLLESETTIAEVLKENGYATAHFGKWHLGMPVHDRENPTPADHGFDYWFGLVNGPGPSHKDPTNFIRNGKRVGAMKGYSCQIVVDEALTWIDEKRADDEPFFLNLWFNEPHAPIAAPDEIVSQYGALDDQAAIYSGTIDNTDRAIGRLVAKLKKLGELDNTIIAYASDNGSYLQERNGELRDKKGSLFEGGHRVPGIIYWKDGIPGDRVTDEPAGVVDLLPTLCGLIGIKKPRGVHLDGSDLTPLLTGTETFERHQPLFWMSGANMVLRMGDHTLFANGTAKSPIDFKTADRLMKQIKEVLGDDLEKELGGMDFRSRLFNGRLANPEANRLKDQHRDLYYFQEAWIPELKKGGIGRVQLYDLSKDLGQQNDIAKERPELVARMKEQAAAIYRSVMADAPEWLTPEELAAAKKPQENTPDRPAPGASDTDTAKLLARIDKNPLPKGYQGSRHQPYVDHIMAGLKPEQRARVGQLWKEKRRLDSDMPNPGASFVRILTHVAEGSKGLAAMSTTGLSLKAPAQQIKNASPAPDTLPGSRAEIYKKIGGVELPIHIFEPENHKPKDKRPAIVFFFGGGWRGGTPAQFQHQCEYLASRGMVAMTVEYRVLNRHGVKVVSCLRDAKSAIRWVRQNAVRLGIDPDRLAAGGGSAGGHLAGALGVIEEFDEEGEDLSISSTPNALVLFNPALVLGPVNGDMSSDPETLKKKRERMGVTPEKISPYHHVGKGQPPAIIFHGKKDTRVPYTTSELFAKKMNQHGNRCELVGFEGQQHGFANFGKGGNRYFIATVTKMDEFLASLGYLEGPARVVAFLDAMSP